MQVNFKLSDLLQFLKNKQLLDQKTVLELSKNDLYIKGFSSIYQSKPNTLSRMEAQSFDWSTIHSSVIICSKKAVLPKDTGVIYIPVDHPRDAFAIVLNEFYPKRHLEGISSTAIIGENCQFGKDIFIGHHVVIGDNVIIGDHTQIHHHVTIKENVEIGSNCIIHSGVVIGAEGFGYQKDTDGTTFKFPHIGGVSIGDNVEVGSNSCIARGKLSNTVIKNNVKIGNLSHISHDVTIEEDAMITHQVHLGGNTIIEKNSWVAPGVIQKQATTIGENAIVGMGAVVTKNVNKGDVVAGVPAKSISKNTSS
jgi:UDP-3-O-[3-hydroxymyristoyl] glucosamine N-acyltransferase